MAGGEFCGNASMCAATYYVNDKGFKNSAVILQVSGADGPVMAEIEQIKEGMWRGTVDMPRPVKQEFVDLPGAGRLPVVSFDGISHVIYEVSASKPSGSYSDVESASDTSASHFEADNRLDELPISRSEAEALAYDWCRYLGVDALGIMFLNTEASSMTPLVYVPAAGTLFWENSCASGTTACGAYVAARSGRAVSMSLRQPGGSLEIRGSEDRAFVLSGMVRITHSGSADITV
jgi:diaminopimelate epimerase